MTVNDLIPPNAIARRRNEDSGWMCYTPHGADVVVHYCIEWTPPTLPQPKSCTPTHTVLEKKSNSYVHTPPSGKMVLPHHQSHFTVKNAMAASTENVIGPS